MRLPLPLVLAALLSMTGCVSVGSPTERWVEQHFDEFSYGTLFNVVLTTVDAEGFPARVRNPDAGEIESDWVYGTSVRKLRGPSRRKAIVRISSVDGAEGVYLVRLRVAEEVLRKGGLLAAGPQRAKEDDWESFQDNVENAEFLMQKIVRLVAQTERASGSVP